MHPTITQREQGKLALQARTCLTHQHIPSPTRIIPQPPAFLGVFPSRGEGLARRTSLPSCLCPLGHMSCLGGSHLVFFVLRGTSPCVSRDFCCFLCCCCFLLVKCYFFSLTSFLHLSLLISRQGEGRKISESLHHKIVLAQDKDNN